jgi:hypothetical protein
MIFDNLQTLTGGSIVVYNRVTSDRMEQQFQPHIQNGAIQNLVVGTYIQTQQGRRLQTATPLQIICATSVRFQSTRQDWDVTSILGGAFNTESDRKEYIADLQAAGGRPFDSISQVTVVIDGVEQQEDTGGAGINIFIIVGAVAGGLAVAVLILLIACRNKSPRKEIATAASSQPGQERINTDIVVQRQDDISTLGDPFPVTVGMLLPGLDRDDTVTASFEGDYDYSKDFGKESPATRARADTLQSVESLQKSSMDMSSLGGLGKMDNSMSLADDLSFEQQFADLEQRIEVDAPAGKLGMVIDTPTGGFPVVHAIKDTSVLVGRVEVGDRLLSVDDEDTTGMTAMQVSKLISDKANNPSRILVFERTRTRTHSLDIPQ